jgi:hypothetical protein
MASTVSAFLPVVRDQLSRLIRRHLGFIAALFIAQTIALNPPASARALDYAKQQGRIPIYAHLGAFSAAASQSSRPFAVDTVTGPHVGSDAQIG